MFTKLAKCGALLILSSLGLDASAGVMSSTNKADFALNFETFPTTSLTFNDIVSDSGLLTLRSAVGQGNPATETHAYDQRPASGLPGDEYVLFGDENFDVLFSSPQTAFAFDYHDDGLDSLFTLNFFSGAANVGTISFTSSSPFNTNKFIGFYSDTAFDRVTIRETDSGNTNEFFQFYSARFVPEPTSLAVFMVGAVVAAFPRRRR